MLYNVRYKATNNDINIDNIWNCLCRVWLQQLVWHRSVK